MNRTQLVSPTVPDRFSVDEMLSDIAIMVRNGDLTTGEWTKKVEEELVDIHDCKHALLTSSGTTAATLLIQSAFKKKRFDRIDVQDFTWKSIKDLIKWIFPWGKFNFVDIDKEDWISENKPPKKSHARKLFIPTMTFGNVKAFDDSHQNYEIIYDSTHCIGLPEVGGRGLGEFLSFSPAKMITGGEGGAILTNDSGIYETARKMRRYHGRISEMNACLLHYSLKKLDEIQTQRYRSWNRYHQRLSEHGFVFQKSDGPRNYSEIACTHENAEDLRPELSKLFDIRQRYAPDNPARNPISARIYDQIIILPAVTGEGQDQLINKIIEIVEKMK